MGFLWCWECVKCEQVSGFLGGERDYSKLEGDTGPLVYPAGFLYVYSAIQFLTGAQVYPAQVMLGFLLFPVYAHFYGICSWMLYWVNGVNKGHTYMLHSFLCHVSIARYLGVYKLRFKQCDFLRSNCSWCVRILYSCKLQMTCYTILRGLHSLFWSNSIPWQLAFRILDIIINLYIRMVWSIDFMLGHEWLGWALGITQG